MRNCKSETIGVGGVSIELTRKNMRSLRLHVTPEGAVRLSVPLGLSDAEIERFVLGKLDWIKEKQANNVPDIPEGCIRFFGETIRRRVLRGLPESCKLENGELILYQRFPADSRRTEELTETFMREQLGLRAEERIRHYAGELGVEPPPFRIRRMSSRWGSWSPSSRTVSLNLKLAELSPRCLDYVAAHELCHVPEPNHGPHFHALLDRVLPDNRTVKFR